MPDIIDGTYRVIGDAADMVNDACEEPLSCTGLLAILFVVCLIIFSIAMLAYAWS